MKYGMVKMAAAVAAFAASSVAMGATVVDPVSCEGGPGVNVVIQAGESTEIIDRCGSFGEDQKSWGSFFEDTFFLNDNESALILGSFDGNTDPFINYAFGVSNNTNSTITYTFTFSSPFVGGPYNTYNSSHSSSITDGGNGTVTIGAPDASGFVHNALLNGVDVTAVSLADGCTVTGAAGFSAQCDTAALASTSVSTGATGTFGIRLRFSVSPRDSYSANGRVELTNVSVPAPAVLGLLGLGLLGAGLLRRRAA